ncbi:sugar phosphate isomerase/epimerase family protein [Fontivita pretiosa]|uniref:sugar phosphate isomerase/epimerase family protein n=1 Tax=Fontivita pretiosa TaxID=2989684 RepID=UPI003D17B02A
MAKIPLAVQLYTLRNQIKDDFAGVVRAVSRIGYAGVELAGYGNLKTAAEVRKAVEDAGLKIAGNHVSLESLEKELNRTLDEQDALGNRMITVSYLPEQRRKDANGWRSCAEAFMRVAPLCQKRGFTLAYHNHSFEFQKFNGQSGFDILWENTDPALLRSQLDVYWVRHADEDPLVWLNKLGRRVVSLHLKDMAAGPQRRFAPVGTGILDFRAIISAAERLGTVQWNIVEQDDCYDTPSIEAVRISFQNLKAIGAV